MTLYGSGALSNVLKPTVKFTKIAENADTPNALAVTGDLLKPSTIHEKNLILFFTL